MAALKTPQQPSSFGLVELKQFNDPTLGIEFEEEIALYSVLTLKNHLAVAREVKFADKFDDIVLSTNADEFYLHQLKHKKDSTKNITWEDLLFHKNKFSLEEYFESYKKIKSNGNVKIDGIKALVIVTNVGFGAKISSTSQQQDASEAAASKNPTDLTSTAKEFQVLQRAKKKNKKIKATGQTVNTTKPFHPITQNDLDCYFECLSIGKFNIDMGKSYKLTPLGIESVTNCLLALSSIAPDVTDEFNEFLKLFVIEVDAPLGKIRSTNKALLETYFPFHCSDEISHEQCYRLAKEKVLELFKPVNVIGASGGCYGRWITAMDRRKIFDDLIFQLKQQAPLGSVKGYELGALSKLLNDELNNLDHIDAAVFSSPSVCLFKNILQRHSQTRSDVDDSNPENDGADPIVIQAVVNVYNDKSTATMTTLKIFKGIQINSPIMPSNKTLIVQVHDEQAIRNIVQHFKKLNEDVKSFKDKEPYHFFIVEVSPSSLLTPEIRINEAVTKLATELSELEDLRTWIQFIIVTRHKIATVTNLLEYVYEDPPLSWNDLPEVAKNRIFSKTLRIEHGMKTSLKSLGVEQETIGDWLDSVALSELIMHSGNKRSLRLALPEHDADLDDVYITRKIKLPLIVKTDEVYADLNRQLAFSSEEYSKKSTRNVCHLLQPFTDNLHVWLKSNWETDKNFNDLKCHVMSAKDSEYSIDEKELLDDTLNYSFGSKGNRLIVVVDKPGKGKTMLLTSLANNFLMGQKRESELNRLMVRVNLLEVNAPTWEMLDVESIKNEKAALSFLVNDLLSVRAESSALSDALLKHLIGSNDISAPRVFLLFDGFDEIKDSHRSIMFRLLESLLLDAGGGVKRIVLASRPDIGLETLIENRLKQFSLYLKDLDEGDQVRFLEKRWKVRWRKETPAGIVWNAERVEHFAKLLVQSTRNVLKDEHRSFLDIPLQCMIVSECFFDDLKTYLLNHVDSADNKAKFFEDGFDLLNLYERFYETKVNILFYEKAGLLASKENSAAAFVKTDFKANCFDAMIRLSIFYMTNNVDDAKALGRVNWTVYRNARYREDLERASRLGLIHALRSHQQQSFGNLDAPHVKFIHRTFAEYFFATFLFKTFTQSECDLLNDTSIANRDIQKMTFRIVYKKVLIDASYAGVRRFFGRLLRTNKNALPPVQQQCPFTTANRVDVLAKWPAIGHQEFNRLLVDEYLVLHTSEMFKNWHRLEKDYLCSNYHLERDIGLYESNVKLMAGLFDLVKGEEFPQLPSVTALVMRCIKEYVTRPSVSDDHREALSHSLILAFLAWLESANHLAIRSPIITLFLQWFDVPIGLSGEQNNVLSTWYFKIVYWLIYHGNGTSSYLEALGLACRMLNNHRFHMAGFEGNVASIAEIIFDMKHCTNSIAAKYFETNIADTSKLEENGQYFCGVLSLSTLVLPNTSVLKLQVDWFRACLMMANSNSAELASVNPFAFVETLEFLTEKLDEHKSADETLSEMKQTLTTAALEFTCDALPRFLTLSNTLNDPVNAKEKIVSTLLWRLILSDSVNIPDDHAIHEGFSKVFFTSSVWRKVLIEYAIAECDCGTQNKMPTHFPFSMHDSKSTRDRFKEWLDHKVHLVWEPMSETEFVNFLLGTELNVTANVPAAGDDVEALPCLLFSDVVSPHIVELSREGLEHLQKTLRNLRLPSQEKSLWEIMIQGHKTGQIPDSCKHSPNGVADLLLHV